MVLLNNLWAKTEKAFASAPEQKGLTGPPSILRPKQYGARNQVTYSSYWSYIKTGVFSPTNYFEEASILFRNSTGFGSWGLTYRGLFDDFLRGKGVGAAALRSYRTLVKISGLLPINSQIYG